ncbi:hypothetical protein BJN45_12840 [Azonexus hydrophilus]|uniref:Transporter n=1 Tax=Azonexus hydrophilus TaxID=418702 RepID=A0A1R1I349_9RHOO|nr:hypothetical protein [Azonexus hydrophilus]OMG53113.1 hypothetical protein BJN45_12840 [Azonexus hydrophilus]
MNKRILLGAGLVLGLAQAALAHHGVAGVGVAALQGPGAPIESAASSVLPEGGVLAYLKVDEARFRKYDWAAPNADYARFTMLGLGYGVTPWFSAYVFVPHNTKVEESGGLDSRGWADMSLMGQVGFRYDQDGWRLTPANESLDDLEDWHFSVFAGATVPTGSANHRLADGSIDAGKSLGFGKPAWSLGITASKMLSETLTLSLEASTFRFQPYTYDNGERVQFGAENRLNGALAWRALTLPEQRFRLDPVLELQYLTLGRDRVEGVGERGTGGRMLYVMPGVRAYWHNASFALGVKKPVWTDLNESSTQQGAEGKEKYRLVFSASLMF